jgi:hypothetical protein
MSRSPCAVFRLDDGRRHAGILGPHQEAMYEAERASIDALGVSWRQHAHVQRHIDQLIGSGWFFDRWPWFVRCTVERRGRGSKWSTCQPLDTDGPDGRPTEGVILLADGSARQPIVLHELAHLLAPVDAGHRRPFAQTLLTLVREDMGFVAFAEFRHGLQNTAGGLFAGVDGG